MDGVKTLPPPPKPPEAPVETKPLTSLIPPAFSNAATESEVLAALDKVQAKSPEVQKAVAEAMSALVAVAGQSGNIFGAATLDGLVKSIVASGKEGGSSAFDKLYDQLSAGIAGLVAANQDNPEALKTITTVQAAAESVIQLMQKGNSDEAEAKKAIDAALAKLATLAEIPVEGATDAQKLGAALAAALYNTLSVAAEADALGDTMSILKWSFKDTPFLMRLPDALATVGNATNQAIMALNMLLSAQIMQEVSARNNEKDQEFQANKAQEDLRKQLYKMDAKQASEIKDIMGAESESEDALATGKLMSSSAFIAALGQCGDVAADIINKLIMQHQIDSVPRNPA
jgi:hypothetical protein